MTLNVLVVDDDANVREVLCARIREMGHHCREAENVTGALAVLDTEKYDLILTDYKMDDFDGIYLVNEIKNSHSDSLVVMMTAFASIDKAVAVIKQGAFDFVAKPFNSNQLRQLLQKVEKLVEGKASRSKGSVPAKQGRYFAGLTSPPMLKLKAFVEKVAPTDATILLTGDSGTGKSYLAKEFHNRSRVKDGPFVEVHCTTLPSELIESELFGHEKGSFTGATKSKKGKIQEAEKGTLFLDEIGELPPSGQAKLLRFLQEKQIDPVGSNKSYFVDTRIIAATNKNLLEMVKQGQFREDLYYRLNMFECLVAPLRERREDVPVLMERFIRDMEESSGGIRYSMDEELKRKFLDYSWPGNVRELKNTIERLCYLSADGELKEDDLPEKYFESSLGETFHNANSSGEFSDAANSAMGIEMDLETKAESGEASASAALDLPSEFEEAVSEEQLLSLEQLERNHIERVLEKVKNLDQASEILGITTVTLWRKRKQYGLS